MKSGVWVLDHDTGYRNMKKDLVKRFGEDAAQRIWEKAGANWESFCSRYAHLPEKVKQHTDGQMFRMAALSMALKEAFPDEALEILGAGVEKEGRRIAKLLSKALYIPVWTMCFCMSLPKCWTAPLGKMLDSKAQSTVCQRTKSASTSISVPTVNT